jgi:hypothetical protein
VEVTCSVCGEVLHSDAEVADHQHEIPLAWENAGAGFECPICRLWFDSEDDLMKHQATGHEGRAEAP